MFGKLFSKNITYKKHTVETNPQFPEIRIVTIHLNKSPGTKWITKYNKQHSGNFTFGLGRVSGKTIIHDKIQKDDIDKVIKSTKEWIQQSNEE